MRIEELKAHYGSWTKMMRELDLGVTTYAVWLRAGHIPFKMQCFIEHKTNRRFKADMNHAK